MTPEDGEALYLVPGVNGKLWLYAERYYEQLADKLASELAPGADEQAFDEYAFALASRIEWDGQGRILISENVLREYALEKQVTVVCKRDHAELWNQAEWAARAQNLRAHPPAAVRPNQKNAPAQPSPIAQQAQ